MILTRGELLTTVRRVGVLGAIDSGYFDNMLLPPGVSPSSSLTFQYSDDGMTGWSSVMTPTSEFWRWSTDGGSTYSNNGVRFKPETPATKIGWLSYANLDLPQVVEGGMWTTIENDGLGSDTNIIYAPDGVTRMLDPATGTILLDELKPGDEVYIRHVINVIPSANNLQYQFSHSFGSGTGSDRVPIGSRVVLNEGGGVPTEPFLLDSHLFITRQIEPNQGMMPQILVSNQATIQYEGCYISVTRR